MFNISFAELSIILLLAFLVLGPKDMSKAARFLGRSVKKCQKFIGDMKTYVNDNTENSSLKDVKDAVSDVKNSVDSVKSEVEQLNPLHELKEEMKPISDLKNKTATMKNEISKDSKKS